MLTSTSRHLQYLEDRDLLGERGLLLAVSAAGLWPNARIQEANDEVDAKCHLCDNPYQDEAHLAWGCPVVNQHDDPHIQKTNFLIDKATDQIGKGRDCCYWTRGLVPKSFYPKIPPVIEIQEEFGDIDAFSNAILFSSDGSGGPNSSDQRTRICGAGAAAMAFTNGEVTLLGG